MKNISAFILFCFLVSGCRTDDKTYLLIGQWQGVSWKINGKESDRSPEAVEFTFNKDKTYNTAYESEFEKGTFRLSGDKLYTTGENKIEKMVKLSNITSDTIAMDMNRSGIAEQIILVKKK